MSDAIVSEATGESSDNPVISLGPSYDELFDLTDYCEYPEWRTVLSLAAYFVDVMRAAASGVVLGEDAYPLKQRRPDLWTLELDRQNSETVIPALDIVLDVLGEHICPTAEEGKNTVGSSSINATSASRIADHYACVYQELVASVYPFNLPFNRPLTQIRQCLARQGTSLPQIWENLIPVQNETTRLSISRETLYLSLAQWYLYSSPKASDERLNTFFGLPADTASTVAALTPVGFFLEKTGLSSDQLNQLLYQDLSVAEIEAEINASFFINASYEDSELEPIGIVASEQDGEVYKELTNLTNLRLDHVNRFVRLAQAIGWSYTDLEWALQTAANVVGRDIPEIDNAALPFLAWIRSEQEQAGLTANQLCACIGVLKDIGGAGGPTFFDSVFNNPNVPNPPADWYATTWTVPQNNLVMSGSDYPDDGSVQEALQAALRVGESQLVAMGTLVLQALGATTQALPLTPQNLGILYRLSLLPAICGLPFDQCVIAIDLPGLQSVDGKPSIQILGGAPAGDTLALFALLQRLSAWLSTAKVSLSDLQYCLTGQSENVALLNKVLGRDAIVNFLNIFHDAFRPTLATKKQFSNAVIGMVQGLTPAGQTPEEIILQLWNHLLIRDPQTTGERAGGWINRQRIVVAIPSVHEIFAQIEPDLNPESSGGDVERTEGIKGLADLIQNFLVNTFELQQAAQHSVFGGLIGVSETLVPMLSFWAVKALNANDAPFMASGIRGGDHAIEATPATWLEEGWATMQAWALASTSPVSDSLRKYSQPDKDLLTAVITKVKTFLRVLCQYAYLAKTMRLSSAEARSIILHSQRFGVASTPPATEARGFKLTFQNVETFWEFRKLLQTYQDTQNHLLDYLSSPVDSPVEELAKSLADIILMDPAEVTFLMHNLWPASETTAEQDPISGPAGMDAIPTPPPYLTVNGINLISAYQKVGTTTGLNIPTLFQLVQMAGWTLVFDFFKAIEDAYLAADDADRKAEAVTQASLKTQASNPSPNYGEDPIYLEGVNLFFSGCTANVRATTDTASFTREAAEQTQITVKSVGTDALQTAASEAKIAAAHATEGAEKASAAAVVVKENVYAAEKYFEYVNETVVATEMAVAAAANAASAADRLAGSAAKIAAGIPDAATHEMEITRLAGLAATLWGSLQAFYRDQPEVIANLRNALNLVTRDAMVGLVRFNLQRREIPVFTTNDLYSYLLLDVEVSSAVETTWVLSAASSVQLYVNRCVNNIEPNVTVTSDLLSQWPWMKNYRTWQANRQVFLYPENYIQPELLPQASPLYDQLIDDLLGQSNLSDPASITEAFQKYLDGFSKVANLRIVGVAVRDFTDDDRAFKEVGLVGQTLEQPVSYYFRSAVFARQQPTNTPTEETSNWSGYISVDWRPWASVAQTITAVGPVTPVFAYGKWFLFWIEEQQTGSQDTGAQEGADTSEQTPTYGAIPSYTFQTFNRSWTTPQKIREQIELGTERISQMASAEKPYWDRIYPAFFNSAQLIMVPYGNPSNTSGCYLWSLPPNLKPRDPSADGLHTAYRYVLPYTPSESPGEGPLTAEYTSPGGTSYAYCVPSSSDQVRASFDGSLTFSAWFEVEQLPETSESVAENVANPDGSLLQPGYWYQISLQEPLSIWQSCPDAQGGYSVSAFGNELFLGYLNPVEQSSGSYVPEFSCWAMDRFLSSTWKGYNSNFTPSIVVIAPNKLGMAWADFEGLLYIEFDLLMVESGLDVHAYLADAAINSLFGSPALILWQTYVYIFGYNPNIYYVVTSNLSRVNYLNVETFATPSVAVFPNGRLYLAGVNNSSQIFFGYLTRPSPQDLQDTTTLSEKTNLSPSLAVFEEKLYIAWAGIDGFLNMGWIVDSANGAQTLVRDRMTLLGMGTSVTSPVLFVYENYLMLIWNARIYFVSHFWINTNYILPNSPSASVSNVSNPSEIMNIAVNLTAYSGSMQEVLYYRNHLPEQAFEDLHTDSVGRITRDISTQVPLHEAFGNSEVQDSAVAVLGQPNWTKISAGGGEYLATEATPVENVGQLVCWRLNSTAFYALSQTLFAQGISALLSMGSQRSEESPFTALEPNTALVPEKFWPPATIDFHLTGALSDYYWELFFYAPFLIANDLSTAQKFEDAQRWYRYIFNPTVTPEDADLAPGENPNDRFWRFLGLRSSYNLILSIELGYEWRTPLDQSMIDTVMKADWQAQLDAYAQDPFDPQAIARLRPIAYQITLFMKTVDNLIQWGDALYRVNTVESLSEAMMLYVEAQDLLGPNPENVGACLLAPVEDIEDFIDEYGALRDIPEFLIQIENDLSSVPAPLSVEDLPHIYLDNIYFGIPENPQFTTYWDVVFQRIYNINHGLNIDGQFQQPALLAPPIDPNQLVQQVASGQEVGSTPASLQVDVPYYRFDVMIDKALEVTSKVVLLGQAFLRGLQSQDAEALIQLYNTNEQTLLNQTAISKEDQLKAAEENVKALQAALVNAQARVDHYTKLIDNGLLQGEISEIDLKFSAIALSASKLAIQGMSMLGYSVPNIFGLACGGMQIGGSINASANIVGTTIETLNATAGLAGLNAGFIRRSSDWEFQRNLARNDADQIQYQVFAAQYQQRIAEQEIDLWNTQMEQAQTVAYFLTTKFTNQQLYQWMAGKLSALYSQSYELAYNLALSAQRAWQFERCDDSQVFINSGSWNNLYDGLIASDALQYQLQSMEAAYLSQNARRFEIRKTVSLQQFDLQALLDLRNHGSCMFSLTEKDFDYDYPGQYCRQIKSVSLSFPSLAGSNRNLHAILTQTANKILMLPDEGGVAYLLRPEENPIPASNVLRQDWRANQQIALSQELDDSGLFVMNFDDPRYLPYESTGAISNWVLELPKRTNPINFDSITDVIIQFNYTAVAGSKSFQQYVIDKMGEYAGARLFLLASEYTNAWDGFINAGAAGASKQEMAFPISEASFPMNLVDYALDSFYIQMVLTENGLEAAGRDTLPTLLLRMPSSNGQEAEIELPLIIRDGIVMTEPEAAIQPPELTNPKPLKCSLAVKNGPSEFMQPVNVLNLALAIGYRGPLLPM